MVRMWQPRGAEIPPAPGVGPADPGPTTLRAVRARAVPRRGGPQSRAGRAVPGGPGVPWGPRPGTVPCATEPPAATWGTHAAARSLTPGRKHAPASFRTQFPLRLLADPEAKDLPGEAAARGRWCCRRSVRGRVRGCGQPDPTAALRKARTVAPSGRGAGEGRAGGRGGAAPPVSGHVGSERGPGAGPEGVVAGVAPPTVAGP